MNGPLLNRNRADQLGGELLSLKTLRSLVLFVVCVEVSSYAKPKTILDLVSHNEEEDIAQHRAKLQNNLYDMCLSVLFSPTTVLTYVLNPPRVNVQNIVSQKFILALSTLFTLIKKLMR